MTTVFIAGSISISSLHEKVRERINKIVTSDLNVVVGDADGADTSIQECLRSYCANKVTVYCTGEKPRNNIANWPVHHVQSKARAGTRAFFTAKDLEMAKNSDYGLMVWDGKSTGTLSNVIELLKKKKKSVVFVDGYKDFVTISGVSDLDNLLGFMPSDARAKAEKKIGLSVRISEFKQVGLSLDDPIYKVDLGAVENESVKLRTILMSTLSEYIVRAHLSQSQAAKMFGVTQPRISDLTRGKVDVFGLDTLVNMASTAGLHVEMKVSERL